MATGDTEPPLAMSSSPPPDLDNSPSNLSSPLSEVEDKDGDNEDVDMDMHDHDSTRQGTPKRNGDVDGVDSDAASDSDDDSKLSEVDVNDSEAETERLYDTPPKNGATRDGLTAVGDVGNRRFTDRRDRVFERSPSKLHQQLKASLDAETATSSHNSLSDPDDEDDDNASVASSEPDPAPPKEPPLRSPSQATKKTLAPSADDAPTSQPDSQDSVESRKRKRSSLAEQSENEQPLRKRTGSIGGTDRDFSTEDVPMIEDETTPTNPQSASHSGDEEHHEETAPGSKTKEEPAQSVEDEIPEPPPSRSKRGRRGANKKQKSKSPDEAAAQTIEDAPDEPPEDADSHVADEAAPHVDEDHTEDADEEAGAAHRNEEELERKKSAWEELTAIEKQFASFRERLYQERLEQLNREEAMLMGDNPTHPEYLAMLRCLEERREKRIRTSALELDLKMSVLRRRAVAERAQVMSQYVQSVRASREEVLDELGKEWYDTQQERRRFANTTPEYGMRFPKAKTQSIRHAVAYNKEVSILSGFAKHVGFPAAPAINGVTDEQAESDLEAIARLTQPTQLPRQAPTPTPAVFRLGPAGEQFIEQTPWANPNHPSHQLQRQQLHQQPAAGYADGIGSILPTAGAVPLPTAAVTGTAPKKQPQPPQHRPEAFGSSMSTILNGDSPVQVVKHAAVSLGAGVGVGEVKGKMVDGPPVIKREGMIHAS